MECSGDPSKAFNCRCAHTSRWSVADETVEGCARSLIELCRVVTMVFVKLFRLYSDQNPDMTNRFRDRFAMIDEAGLTLGKVVDDDDDDEVDGSASSKGRRRYASCNWIWVRRY